MAIVLTLNKGWWCFQAWMSSFDCHTSRGVFQHQAHWSQALCENQHLSNISIKLIKCSPVYLTRGLRQRKLCLRCLETQKLADWQLLSVHENQEKSNRKDNKSRKPSRSQSMSWASSRVARNLGWFACCAATSTLAAVGGVMSEPYCWTQWSRGRTSGDNR